VSVVANVAINVDSRNAVSKLRQVQTQAQATEKAFGALQSAIGALGVGFALTKVIADVKELDTNLRRLGTVGGDVKALDKGLGTLSRNLDGIASKAELAAASYQALSAGFTDTASNLKVVEAATKAAVGGLVDVTGVVEVTTKTLNAYNMSGDQATKVTDSISKAIEFGQVQWSDYTSQLGRVASIAAIAGVSLDEVNAFIAAATKNGATAEVAFTGLGATLAMMLKPSKESAEAAEALGINWTLAGIRGEGFESLMGKLAIAMQKNPVLATEMVGGQEALRGAFAAAAKGGQDYQMILEGLNGAAGKTDADFQTMKGSLENTLKALDTAFKNLSEALGTAFGPTLVITIQDITKGVNGFADVMGSIPQPVMNAVGELVKLIAQILLLQKGIQAIIALRTGFVATMVAMGGATAASGTAAKVSAGSFALYTNNTRALQIQAAATTPALQGMLATLRNLAAIGTIAILVNVAVTGMAAVYQAQAEIDRLRGVRGKGGAAAAFGGSATAEQKKSQKETLAAIQKERLSPGFQSQQAAAAAGVGKTMARQRADLLTEREQSARAILALPTRGQATPTVPTAPTIPTGGVGGDDKKKKGKSDAERAAEAAAKLEQQTQERLRSLARETELIGQITNLKELQAAAEAVSDTELQARLAGEEQIVNIIQRTAQELDGVTDERLQQKELSKAQAEIDQVRVTTSLELQRIEDERTKNFEQIIADLDFELKLKQATTEEAREQLRLENELRKLKGQGFTDEQRAQITGKQTQLAAPDTAAQTIEKRIGTLKKEVAELTNIGNMAITVADGIGVAFSQAFQGLISGSMSAEEALGSFFKSVGDMFVSMAAEIIAKQMTMIILQTILKALGAVGGVGGGGGGNSATALGSNPNVAAYSSTGIGDIGIGTFGRAGGGPTAAGTPYLVGERGPELFVPGTSGGVMSNSDLRSAMNSQGGGGAGSPVLNMSFESTTIGGVEYVSREQLEQAMAETRRAASRDGAQRGMTMTLDRIQNSNSTRRRIGV
jgi:TP901 family phage tail tape measure protein